MKRIKINIPKFIKESKLDYIDKQKIILYSIDNIIFAEFTKNTAVFQINEFTYEIPINQVTILKNDYFEIITLGVSILILAVIAMFFLIQFLK